MAEIIVSTDTNVPYQSESYFDGGLTQLIGIKILGFIVTFFTLCICYPWAMSMIYRWRTKHMIVDGRRLIFDGNGFQLFGSYIKWWMLSIITLGIYSFWIAVNLEKWRTKHTHFSN